MASHTDRIHNFSAGPAVLPLEVVSELQEALPNLEGTGVGLMEISHRSPTFGGIVERVRARTRRILGLPDDFEVLFLQGGASTQFLMVPQNLLQGEEAMYVDTGTWSSKAIKEARRFGSVREGWSGASSSYLELPQVWPDASGCAYAHYTSNNTIYGTQFSGIPETQELLVCDASSDIASRRLPYDKIDLLYAGAQKNLGPSGVTLVVLSPRAVERARRSEGPTMLRYATHVDKGSLFNTPNTLGVWMLERMLAWMERQGMDQIEARNQRKSGKLYELLDSSDFWKPQAHPEARSMMNVTWRIHDPALEELALAESSRAGLSGLKGHRSVGGLRASLYNALPEESVDVLVDFLRDFERRHG